MNEYTASNGRKIKVSGATGYITITPVADPVRGVASYDADALREFFKAEEDERLGRWRSEKSPEWTAIVQEGSKWIFFRHEDGERAFSIAPDGDNLQAWAPNLMAVAREYLAAHPEPKPAWHEAKPGEVWALGIGGGYHGESIAVVETPDGLRFVWGVKGGDIRSIPVDDRGIDYGTRIYPEVSS